MSTIIHQRVELCRRGEYEKQICRVESGWVVLGDVQFVRGYSLILPDPVVADVNQLSVEQRAILFHIEAWDINCSKHLPDYFSMQTIRQTTAKLTAQISSCGTEMIIGRIFEGWTVSAKVGTGAAAAMHRSNGKRTNLAASHDAAAALFTAQESHRKPCPPHSNDE